MSLVRTVREGSLLHLILDAPERRNALSKQLLGQLCEELRSVDDAVTGIVLSGAGSSFSAGADFADLTGTSQDIGYDDALAEVTAAVREHSRLVVAAIEGPCMGAAADLALSCDLRVLGSDAFMQVPAVRLGLLYNPEAVGRLARTLPRDTVRRLLLLGERFDAETASEAGLASYVVSNGTAVQHSVALLGAITTQELDALAATKALLNAHDSGVVDADHWAAVRRQLLDSPARRTAVAQARSRHTSKEN